MIDALKKWSLAGLTIVVIGAFAYQFWRIGQRVDWSAFWTYARRPEGLKLLVLVLCLMPVNWLLEARKWQLLLNAFLPWSYVRTLVATLAGLSVSAATPNRVGEIGGRLLAGSRAEAPAILASSLLGSLCQWVAFLLLAWPGLIWSADFSIWWLPLGPLVLVAGWALGKPLLLKLLEWLDGRWRLRTAEVGQALRDVKLSLILRAGGYACGRFLVYCGQLWLLLGVFGLVLPPLEGMAGIMAIYLIQAGLPLPPGANLAARTELGLILWDPGDDGSLAVLLAFTTLFLINVLLPALPAYWFVLKKQK